MLANIGLYVGVSLWRRGRASRRRARRPCSWTCFEHAHGVDRSRLWRGSASVAGSAPAHRALPRPGAGARGVPRLRAAARRRRRSTSSAADADLVHFAETQLAGAIGGASARVIVASVVQEEPPGLDEVMDILDEASQVRAYSHELEQKSRELEAATAELRAANAQLQELDRMKDDFMSTVTHELRTPLTSIRAFSEILRDDPRTRRRRARAVPRHHRQGDRAADPPHQPGARHGQDRVRARGVAHLRARRAGGRSRLGRGDEPALPRAAASSSRCRVPPASAASAPTAIG